MFGMPKPRPGMGKKAAAKKAAPAPFPPKKGAPAPAAGAKPNPFAAKKAAPFPPKKGGNPFAKKA